MQIKYSILKQTSEGLVIDLYFSDRPNKSELRPENFETKGILNCVHEKNVSDWLSHPGKTVKVDEGSEDYFEDFAARTLGMKSSFSIQFKNALQQGIEISPDVFEVRERNGEILFDAQDYELAFFKEEKEETQEEIWNEMFKEWEQASFDDCVGKNVLPYLMQKFELKRRKG